MQGPAVVVKRSAKVQGPTVVVKRSAKVQGPNVVVKRYSVNCQPKVHFPLLRIKVLLHHNQGQRIIIV